MNRHNQGSIEVGDTKISAVQSPRKSYDKDKVFKIVGGVRNAIRLGLCTTYDRAVREWLEESPSNLLAYQDLIREKYGLMSEKKFTAAFLALRKKKEDKQNGSGGQLNQDV